MLSIMKDERRAPDAFILKVLLSTASLVYLLLVRCIYFLYKNRIFRSYKVPATVISVGNITLGGTGKTPFTIFLAETVKAMGRRPAVLNRGYGNDESDLLKEKLQDIPVLSGRDRVENAIKASRESDSNCIILDDGFQHYRIKRDLDIVLIDSTYPFGNTRLFPRGILREPLARLQDADIAILTKSDMGIANVDSIREKLMRLNKGIKIAESFYQPVDLKKITTNDVRPLSYITYKKIAILAGVANPDYFGWIVGNIGADVQERFHYPDHHPYSDKDMAYIVKRCLVRDIRLLVTTEKDAIRLKRLKTAPGEIEIYALKINFRFSSNEKDIVDRLHSIFNS